MVTRMFLSRKRKGEDVQNYLLPTIINLVLQILWTLCQQYNQTSLTSHSNPLELLWPSWCLKLIYSHDHLLRIHYMDRNRGMWKSYPGPEVLKAAFLWILFSVHGRLYTQNYFSAPISILLAHHERSFPGPEDAFHECCPGASLW